MISILTAPLATALLLLSATSVIAQYPADGSGYEVKEPPLTTDWTHTVGTNPWTEYPRPQHVREAWQSLNGIWRYSKALGLNELDSPPTGEGKDWGKPVMIPSCIESGLSGLQVDLKDNAFSWFQTKFSVPSEWDGQEVLLNFGAVDYEATVFINGQKIDSHKGGFNRFALAIGSTVKYGQDNELLVFVHDPTDNEEYVIPIGKQTNNPSHIFYTPCSGIWQSVFIEPVPKTFIDRIDLSGDMDGKGTITVHSTSSSSESIKISVVDAKNGKAYESNGQSDGPFEFNIPDVQLWSPTSPNLYNVTVTLGDDNVQTYMGFRSIDKGKVEGDKRFLLNGEFVFTFGPLDQGYWPDGLFTPPSYEAMKFDLLFLKSLGFNMVRKHVKVETDLFYRACDELGLLVIQDMPSTTARKEFRPNDQQQAQFESELKEMVDLHKSFPSIYTWVIYNEGWGQRDDKPEVELAPALHDLDPTRLVNAVSGWNDHGAGDYFDNHHYPESMCASPVAGGNSPVYDTDRIGFQGEFGGMGHNVSLDHLWNVPGAIAAINETYELAEDVAHWNVRTREILKVFLNQVKDNACSGGVWTQTTDVEGEVNGLMTYDRRLTRTDNEQWQDDIKALFAAAAAKGAGDGTGSGAGKSLSAADSDSASSSGGSSGSSSKLGTASGSSSSSYASASASSSIERRQSSKAGLNRRVILVTLSGLVMATLGSL